MRTRACAHACFVGVEERLFTLEDRRDTVDAYLCLKTLNTHQKTVEIADARCLSILILVSRMRVKRVQILKSKV